MPLIRIFATAILLVVLPVMVRLAAINWECECESPTVPQQ